MRKQAPSLIIASMLLMVPVSLWAAGDRPHGAGEGSEIPAVQLMEYRVELLTPILHWNQWYVRAMITTASTGEPAWGGRVQIKVEHIHLGTRDIDNPAAPPRNIPVDDFLDAPESREAGIYRITIPEATPSGASEMGVHRIWIKLLEMDGAKLDAEPMVAFLATFALPKAVDWRIWIIFSATGLMMAIAIYAMALKLQRGPSWRLNLLDIRWVAGLLKWRYFQPVFQAPNIIIFGIVVVLGFTDVQSGGVNLATKLTWTIWWALIIFGFVLLGRLWCLMCPFGAFNEWASRAAKSNGKMPQVFRNMWLATLAFLILTWADGFFGVVSSPLATAWLVVIVSAAAIFMGLFFERRSFCRYACPITGLIGLYSMIAPLQLRARDPKTCEAHTCKECYDGGQSGFGYGCPMFELPNVMDNNNYCNLCMECVKACSHNNLGIRLRALGKDLWQTGERRFDEAYLALILVGVTIVVTGEMVEPWHQWMDAFADWLPFSALGITSHTTIEKVTKSAVFFCSCLILAPALMGIATYLSIRLVGDKNKLTFKEMFTLFAYIFIPVGLSMHLAHNTSHLLQEGQGIWPVLQRAVLKFTPFSLDTPQWDLPPVASAGVVYALQMGILLLFFGLSLCAAYRLVYKTYPDRTLAMRALIPMVSLSLFFTVINIYLLNLPMSMRHAH